MDVSFVNPFIKATIHTFKTMLTVEVTPGKPTIKKEPLPTYDVSGIIGLSGDAQGSVAISFPKQMALKLVSALVGQEIKVVGPDLTDGIGELANIVAGSAKQHFTNYNLSISLPNVVIGKAHTLACQRGIPTLTIPFESPLGVFSMEVTLKTN